MAIDRLPNPRRESISDAVLVSTRSPGRWVYVSGQVAHQPEFEGKEIELQSQGCFDQIEAALAKVGGTLSDVVRITAFLTDLEEYSGYDRVRLERFRDTPPSSASVQVAGLLGTNTKIEIDAVAFVQD